MRLAGAETPPPQEALAAVDPTATRTAMNVHSLLNRRKDCIECE